MAIPGRLSGAHAILLATHLCVTGNVSRLPQVQAQFPAYLPLERVLRIILTFLPESTAPQSYTPVLQELLDGRRSQTDGDDIDVSLVDSFSEAAAKKRVRTLRLLPLKHHDDEDSQDPTDLLTQFLIHRAYRIDLETALQPLILELLLPFYQRLPTVRTWLISSLLPLLRLNYEYYPSQDETFSLDLLESMDSHTAINVLLSMTGAQKNSMDLVNNLRGLLGPWMYGSNRSKRRRLNQAAEANSISLPQANTQQQSNNISGWQYVNEWLLARSLVDYESIVNAFLNWDGPEDADLGGFEEGNQKYNHDVSKDLNIRYGQSGLAVIYSTSDTSKSCLEGSTKVLSRVAKLLSLEDQLFISANNSALPSVTFNASQISSSSRVSLLQNALLVASNPLTCPSASSISFLSAILLSIKTLAELGHSVTCRTAVNICLHSSQETQLHELRNVVSSIVRQTKSSHDWRGVRQQILWLQHWGSDKTEGSESNSPCHGLFWRVSRDVVEAEALKALLEIKEFNLAVDIYINSPTALSSAQVEEAVKEAIFTTYDNASNGNRTRGGMKRAYDILQAFQPHFPESVSFKEIRALISATHALSFYSLTLQHGVPFQPVSIRVHSDPLSLIEKVLDQNSKAYTKVDDLLAIGRNLVAAGFSSRLSDSDDVDLPPTSGEDTVVTAERRIMSLAISSALSSNDFGTAYSYILTRLTPPSLLSTSSPLTNPAVRDDISWRAVYNAGRYRDPALSSSSNLQAQITQLSQRMELLSLALILVPSPDPLPEILGAWRRCDEEMNGLRAREAEEEELWDTKGDNLSSVPGGFGPTDSEQDAYETKKQHARRARAHNDRLNAEEAPMGLFEVARGAALALHKNAFPLNGATTTADQQPTSSSHARGLSEDSTEERVRKRDVVSNMVTGGLVNGIGWVLGAQPVNR
ncbi:Sec39 domain-containing protein [Aspergillus pseudotamarii]|uniref:Sec39 domain-containing protein n=1 Tax=Aspergillus pseudotamarii TaxID=132259 RepID=A0A5N6SG70_ASPPS|nr:Sec39 domain-containing protein [Aspergillus pseudotamarii]KAE8132094.1 Sec39 domain-containing protein [Aspergillus pseudotamarii]